jgi:excisionase family DNA binding protein
MAKPSTALVSIAQAARLTGVARSTIQRALKTGRLSYSPDGTKRVDIAELERVFGLVAEKPSPATDIEPAELIQLRERVRYLELQVTDLREHLVKSEQREAKLFDRMPVPWWRRLTNPKD